MWNRRRYPSAKVGGFDPNVERSSLNPVWSSVSERKSGNSRSRFGSRPNVPATRPDVSAIEATANAPAPTQEGAASAAITTVERLASLVRDATRVRVVVVYGWNPLSVGGPGSFPDALLGRLGADNVVTEGPPYPQLSVERFLELAPDVVLDATADAGMNQPRPSWMNSAMVKAVRNDRVHTVRLAGMLRPGPRVVAGMKDLASSRAHDDAQSPWHERTSKKRALPSKTVDCDT